MFFNEEDLIVSPLELHTSCDGLKEVKSFVTGAKVVHFPRTANFFRGKFRGARKIPRKIPPEVEFIILETA